MDRPLGEAPASPPAGQLWGSFTGEKGIEGLTVGERGRGKTVRSSSFPCRTCERKMAGWRIACPCIGREINDGRVGSMWDPPLVGRHVNMHDPNARICVGMGSDIDVRESEIKPTRLRFIRNYCIDSGSDILNIY